MTAGEKVATIGLMKPLPPWARRLSLMLLALALPVLLITSNVWWAGTSLPLYEYGFSRSHVSDSTGIAPEDLHRVAVEFIAYFRSQGELLDVRVPIHGVVQPLFNERELIHMHDVKGLVRGVLGVRNVAIALLGISGIGGLALGRRRYAEVMARSLRAVGLATAGGVLAVGVILAVAFQPLFRLFHVISFRNLFWMLDPSRDYLVQLFPSRFFFEAVLLVAVATLVEALLVAAVAWGGLRLLRSKGEDSLGPG